MAITRIGPNQSINLASNITGTLPTANGGTGATSFSPSKVLQVINATSTTETVLTNSSTADTGLTANITPASTSNKVLVNAHIQGVGKDNNGYVVLKLVTVTGNGNSYVQVGDSNPTHTITLMEISA